MRKIIAQKFKDFNHSMLFEFNVDKNPAPAELAYLRTKNPKLDRSQICYAYIMLNGERKRIGFSPLWPILPFYSGVVEKLSGGDPSFVIWRDAAFDIIGSRINEFSNMLLQGITDKSNFDDLEELRECFLPWEIKRIKDTGDVEEGAEIALQTEQGKHLLNGENFVSNRLKKSITESVNHKDNLIKQHIRNKGTLHGQERNH